MPIDFYYLPPSPPCRSVMLLAKAVGVHLNLKIVNVMTGDHLKPDFIKMNPQHTIPTMDDNGFVLWESRPIMGYLVDKYAKNDSLYPKDPKKRGIVDQRLYFDIGLLFDNIITCYVAIVFGKTNTVCEKSVEALHKACRTLNMFLDGNEFVAGDTLTIADFAISTSVCMLLTFYFDISQYTNIVEWYERCKTVMNKYGFEDVHEPATKLFREKYHENLKESDE